MKTVFILVLAISLIGNAVLAVMLTSRSATPVASDTPSTESTFSRFQENERPSTLSRGSASQQFENAMIQRVAELRDKGLSKDLVESALVPIMNTHFREKILKSGTSTENTIRQMHKAREDRENLIETLFGKGSARRHYNRKPYRNKSSHQLEFEFESEKDKAIHDIMNKIAGVMLDERQKTSLVEITWRSGNNTDQLRAEIDSHFGQETAAQILKSLEPGYDRAYRMAISTRDELSDRRDFATTLHELQRTRQKALDHWKNADISDLARTVGIRTVERQIQQQLEEELGEGVSLINLNGW